MTDILRDIWGSNNSEYKQVIFHETQIIKRFKCP
jgi:hypothetical protein